MQLHLHRRVAYLATDAHVWRCDASGPNTIRWPDGAPVLVSKQQALPHLRAVLTLIGSGFGMAIAADHLQQVRDLPTAIDTLGKALQVLRGHPAFGDRLPNGQQTEHGVLLVAWHPELRSMVAARFSSLSGWAPQLIVPPGELTGQILTPKPEGLPIPTSIAEAQAFAVATIRQRRAADAYAGLGGEIVTTEISAEGIHTIFGPDAGATPLRPGAQAPTREPAEVFAFARSRYATHLQQTATADAHLVREGGGVEVQWGPAGSNPDTWQSIKATDGQSGVFLGPVQDGNTYLIRARAYNRLASGAWTPLVSHQVVGKTAAPANVSGLASTALPGGVGVSWTPSTEADYAETEVRVGASWAAGTRIYLGPADRFTWPWPTAGSYTLRAKHRDTTGNESATDSTLSVTVGNGNLIPTTGMQPQAATDAFTDETSADSVTIPGTGGTSFKTCATRSYTNTTGRAVVLQWDAEVTGLYFSSGATLAPPADFASATWVLKVNGTPTLTDSFIDTTNDAAVPGSTDRRTRMVGWQYTLAAGDTALLEISVGGGTDINAATISWARTRLRTTVIKA